nr:brct-containing protein 1 [Quercus suber]
MADAEDTVLLFDSLRFVCIPDDELDDDTLQGMIATVLKNGAECILAREQRILDLEAFSHIVSSHIDFPDYRRAIDIGIPVVKHSWVTQCIHKNKIVSSRQHSPDPSQFFQDVVVSIGTLPEYDGEAIIGGVLAMGGLHSGPLTRLVTHIVTTDLDNEKCRIAQEKTLNCKIVLPHWFDDCLKLGKKINERPYLLPNAEVLQRGLVGAPRPAPSPHVEGAVSASVNGMPIPSPPSGTPATSPSQLRKDLDVFRGRTIMLGTDLNLSAHLKNALVQIILQGAGVVTDDVEACDVYIGHYRDGSEYIAASRAQKEVATLSWLYHVINQNRYTNPLRKLLHYPIPRQGLQGFENMKISISNYVGDARTYLENLIKYCGAEFTKTMKQDNTHLIVAHTHSEKCEAAQEWNINIINHMWLEESYAKCAVQTLTNPRFSEFPHRTNLSEIVGQTTLDMKKVEKLYFRQMQESPQKSLPPPSPQVQVKSNAKLSPRKTVSRLATGASLQTSRRTTPTPTGTGIVENEESEDLPEPDSLPTHQYRRGPKFSTASTPRPAKDDEKENAQWMSSGRASKARALDKLHHQADDIANFQKEMKRKGGVTHGGRASSHVDEFVESPAPQTRRKRKSDEMTYDATAVGSDLSDGETQAQKQKPTKKAKSALPPISCKMMVSGYQKWVDRPNVEGSDKTKLRQLGVQITTDPKDVDILVAPKILRTRKFVCALASAPLVVGTDYLDIALTKGKLKQNPSMLHDREAEEKYGFKLTDSLKRAEKNQHQLLREWHIFVTKAIAGGFETYKDIIEVNGGSPYLWSGRTGVTMHEGVDGDEHAYLVCGETPDEVKLIKQFRDQAIKAHLKPRVLSSNWLLNLAMSQEVMFQPAWELQ